jgi:hypothetical protein
MGGSCIIVIGDDFEDQLKKFQIFEYAYHTSRHIISANILNKARQRYAALPDSENIDFVSWAERKFTIAILEDGDAPDLQGIHRYGWIKQDETGQVYEMVERMIPNSFLHYFSCSIDSWKLKPGATGLVSDGYTASPALDGYAGSARKDAIDLDGMREIVHMRAGERWEHAAAVCGSQTWKPLKYFLKKHHSRDFDLEKYGAALREWSDQPSVQAIQRQRNPMPVIAPSHSLFESHVISSLWAYPEHYAIDPLRLPREQYVARHGIRIGLGGYVIKDGVLLKKVKEPELFDSLSGDTMLTYAFVES